MVKTFPRLKLALLLIVSAFLCAGMTRTYFPGQLGDDSSYVSASRGLAQNVGYSRLYSATYFPETTYPAGYPLLLMPLQWAAPQNIHLMQAFTAVFGLMSVIVLWYSGSRFGRGAATLLALNAVWIRSSITIMSDVPFTLVCVLWAGLLQRCQERDRLERGCRLGLVVLLASAILLRSMGIVLFPLTLGLLVYRGFKWEGLWITSASSLIVLPGLVFSRIAGYRDAMDAYPGFWVVASENAKVYLQSTTLLLFGQEGAFDLTGDMWQAKAVLLWMAVFLFLGLFFLAIAKQIREARFVVPLLILAQYIILLVWPFQYVRFWLPLLPFLYLGILEGAEELAKRWGRPRTHHWLVVLLVLAELPALYSGITKTENSSLIPPSYHWILSHTSVTDIVATEKTPVWIHTGRRVVPIEPQSAAGDLEVWIGSLYEADVRWVMLGDRPESEDLIAAVSHMPSHFQQVYADPVEGVHIFELVGDSKKYLEAVGWARAGMLFSRESNFEQTARSVEKAIALQPWFLRPRLGLAEVWMKLGRPTEAVEALRAAQRLYPGHPDVLATIRRLNLSEAFPPDDSSSTR